MREARSLTPLSTCSEPFEAVGTGGGSVMSQFKFTLPSRDYFVDGSWAGRRREQAEAKD